MEIGFNPPMKRPLPWSLVEWPCRQQLSNDLWPLSSHSLNGRAHVQSTDFQFAARRPTPHPLGALPFGYFILKHIRPIPLGTLTLIKSIHFDRMLCTPIISSLTALSNVFWVRLDPSTCLAVIGGIRGGTQKMALIQDASFYSFTAKQ